MIHAVGRVSGQQDWLSSIFNTQANRSQADAITVAPGQAASPTGAAPAVATADANDGKGATTAGGVKPHAADLATPFQQLQSTLQALLLQVQALMGSPPPGAALAAGQSAAHGGSAAAMTADHESPTASMSQMRNVVSNLEAELALLRRPSEGSSSDGASSSSSNTSGDGGASLQGAAALSQNLLQAINAYGAVAGANANTGAVSSPKAVTA